MCGCQVKLCDLLVTRGPYLSTLDIGSLYIKRYINSPSLLYFFLLFTLASILFAPDSDLRQRGSGPNLEFGSAVPQTSKS